MSTVQLGTIVAGDFRVESRIAAGGMGEVFVAEQISTGKRRALKLMKPELLHDPALIARFEQEAKIGARIESDHVVEVVGAGVDRALGMPWLAMELLQGESLGAMLSSRGVIPPGEVHQLFGQIGHALGAAHRAGVVHRDLKPENIFVAKVREVGAGFKVKILDFGIAKLFDEAKTSNTGMMSLGTPRYMAPEQTGGQAVTPAADVWALGLIAFQLLTGRYYWRHAVGGPNDSVMALMREVLFEPLVPASQRAQEYGRRELLPPGFDEWFARAVAREPQQRFQNAGDAVGALLSLLSGARGPSASPAAYTHGASGGYVAGAHTHQAAITSPSAVHTVPGAPLAAPQVGVPHAGAPHGAPPTHSPVAIPPPNPGAGARPKSGGALVWVVAGVIGLGALGVGGFFWNEAREKAAKAKRARDRDDDDTKSKSHRKKETSSSSSSGNNDDGDSPAEPEPPSPPDPPEPPAPAEIVGSYVIKLGRNPNGTTYKGNATIATVGSYYTVNWTTGQNGTGLRSHDVFAAAWGTPKHILTLLHIEGGELSGSSLLTDGATQVEETHLSGPVGLSGTYTVTGGDPGTMTLQPNGAIIQASWTLAQGTITGIGMREQDELAISWQLPGSPGGLVIYHVGGDELVGRWLLPNSTTPGYETLAPLGGN